MPFVWLLYYAGMYLLLLGIHISSLWNKKSAQWIAGRKNWKQHLQNIPARNNHRIWFHVSSLGEFEQARPVIEELKRRKESLEIILTFFSPSGFEIRKNYPLASVHYLPVDLPGNAKKFVDIIQPDIAVFTKYDLWPGFLHQLLLRNIKVILISAYWSPDRLIASWNFPLTKSLLKRFDKIFLQDDAHASDIKKQGFHNIAVAGDTRIDRSLLLPQEIGSRLPPSLINHSRYDLVAGSTWPADEKLIIPVAAKLNLKVIIAPHDVSHENIQRITKGLQMPFQLWSAFDNHVDHQLLIIDNVGLLSVLYALGDIAYVGGGFGKGIHNILEPASHGKPIIFGPNHSKFPEAKALVHAKAAWVVNTSEELEEKIIFLKDNDIRSMAGKNGLDYLKEKAGATDIVTQYLLELLSSEHNT